MSKTVVNKQTQKHSLGIDIADFPAHRTDGNKNNSLRYVGMDDYTILYMYTYHANNTNQRSYVIVSMYITMWKYLEINTV